MSISNSCPGNEYSNSQDILLKDIIHLGNKLCQSNGSNNQLGLIAHQQRQAIKSYLNTMKTSLDKRFSKSYKTCRHVSIRDTKSLVDCDKYPYKPKKIKKVMENRVNPYIYYIGISSFIHNYFYHIRSFITEMHNRLIELFSNYAFHKVRCKVSNIIRLKLIKIKYKIGGINHGNIY